MVNIYCDESHDGHTYTLAGWVGSPTSWDYFSPAWRRVLASCNAPSFHAAEIVNREAISDSRFKGWTFDQEKALFSGVLDVIEDKRYVGLMRPVGCSVTLSGNKDWITTPDTAWKLLFVRLFMTVFQECNGYNGISFMFDEKAGVKNYVDRFYAPAKAAVNNLYPGKIHGAVVSFADDEDEGFEPLQAADLLAYEWRRRITEKMTQPHKPVRKSYERLKSARPDGIFHHYNSAAVELIMEKFKHGAHFVQAMLDTPSSPD